MGGGDAARPARSPGPPASTLEAWALVALGVSITPERAGRALLLPRGQRTGSLFQEEQQALEEGWEQGRASPGAQAPGRTGTLADPEGNPEEVVFTGQTPKCDILYTDIMKLGCILGN